MAKLTKLLLLVILVGGIAAFFLLREQPTESDSVGETAIQRGEPPVRLEEKYGFTSETVGP